MEELYVNFSNLYVALESIKKQKSELNKQYESFLKVKSNLSNIVGLSNLYSSFSIAEEQLKLEIRIYQSMYQSLETILKQYESTENNISSQKVKFSNIAVPQNGDGNSYGDEEFQAYWEQLKKELSKFPPDLKKVKDLIWEMWDTETGNKIEKDFISTFGDVISKFLAFEYNENEDYYYTDENWGIQRHGGFMDLYDDCGKYLGMDLDTEVLTFTPEGSDKEYRLQFWKGSYGFGGAYGSEIGLYSRDVDTAQKNPYVDSNPNKKTVFYECVCGDDEIQTKQEIYSTDGELLFSNATEDYAKDGDHFWNLAIKTDPGYGKEDLVITEHLYIEDPAMQEAIVNACEGNEELKVISKSAEEIVIQYGEFD